VRTDRGCFDPLRFTDPNLPLLDGRDSGFETVKLAVRSNMPDADAIPVIDLGHYLADEFGALDHAAAELRHALTEIGFYSIVNHGVPSALVHEVYRQVARFHARPLDEKLKIKLDKHNVGYLPMMRDTLRTSVVAQGSRVSLSSQVIRCRTAPCSAPENRPAPSPSPI